MPCNESVLPPISFYRRWLPSMLIAIRYITHGANPVQQLRSGPWMRLAQPLPSPMALNAASPPSPTLAYTSIPPKPPLNWQRHSQRALYSYNPLGDAPASLLPGLCLAPLLMADEGLGGSHTRDMGAWLT